MAGRSNGCCRRFTATQTIFAVCLFGISTIISYLAVSFKLSQQWTPDVINQPKSATSFMIQPLHSSNMSISIMSHSVFLEKEKDTHSSDNTLDSHEQNEEFENDKYVVQELWKHAKEQLDLETPKHLNETNNNQPSNDSSNTLQYTSYHPKWDTVNAYDEHLLITNISYEESDFSLWWTDGDGSALFINASKYDKNSTGGYQSFVFCPIPKVGCSAWKQVMRRIKGIDAYLADDYWSLHHFIENGLEMDRIFRRNGSAIDVDRANEILHYTHPETNKSIFHAAFVRDSLERSLSAFLDKCVLSEWHKRYWCRPQSDRRMQQFSNFDIFVEAVISKAGKPKSKFLERYSFWGLDYHWLPQNWICDLYKFISRYHIYDGDNIMDRKYFFLDIGGNKSWNAFGASGWFHHDYKKRKLLQKFEIPSYKKYQYIDTVNNIRREHPPGYRGYKPGDTLDISGSLLSENAAHAQNTRLKVYSYYRTDLVAKLIVFYIDDYVLFKRKLPNWICSFVNVESVLEKIKNINLMYKDFDDRKLKVDNKKFAILQMERGIFFGANMTWLRVTQKERYKLLKKVDANNLLTFGKTSSWHEHTSIKWMKNMTERNMHLFDEFRINTKLKCFYDILIRVDREYGTLFSRLRGISLLLDVLMNVDVNILPNNENKCLLTEDILGEKNNVLIDIMNVYLNEYIPYRLRFGNDNGNSEVKFENKWVDIMKCLHLDLIDGRMDHVKLYEQWHTENIKIFDAIIENMVYTKNMPRNARYQNIPDGEKKAFETEMKMRIARRAKRRDEYRNKHRP
eukprot:49434_1